MGAHGRVSIIAAGAIFLLQTTPLWGAPPALPATSCSIAEKLQERLYQDELPQELHGSLLSKQTKELSYSQEAKNPNALNFYNVRAQSLDPAAKMMGHQLGAVLPEKYIEPILKQAMSKTHEVKGVLNIEHLTDQGEGGSFNLKIDFLPQDHAHQSLLTVPHLPQHDPKSLVSVPRIEVRVEKERIHIFSCNSYGLNYGHTLINEMPTSHGLALTLNVPHGRHDPVVLDAGIGISKFFVGPDARPALLRTAEYSLRLAQALYPDRVVLLKAVDQTLEYNPKAHAWVAMGQH